MSEKLRESLSAAIDDEADEFELRRVLDEMQKDPELRHLWERYHMAGRVMRGERPDSAAQLRDRVWAALGETDATAPQLTDDLVGAAGTSGPGRRGPWLGRMSGVAVAATVALAIVFGVGSGEQAQPQPAEVVLSIDGPKRQAPKIAAEISPSDVERANAYMMHHVQQQALNHPGVASFVKLVTYEDQ
jgi:sigma-E factor negative regulatory protein RseA